MFNNLVPGAISALFFDGFVLTESLFDMNIVIVLVVCYVLGVIGSRIGSVVLEPLAKRVGLIRRGEYSRFVQAKKIDGQIDVLVTISSMYRSLAGSAVLSTAAFLYSLVPTRWRFCTLVFAAIGTFILLIASWCKQELYVVKRIDAAVGEEKNADR